MVQKFLLEGLKNTENVMVSSTLSMDPARVLHLDPTRKLTASCSPELYWQLTHTYRIAKQNISLE